MYYPNEIREVAGYGKAEKDVKLKAAEVKLAEQLVASLSQDFKPEQFHDKFQENLKALIEAKNQEQESSTKVVDITGMHYNPITGAASFTSDTSVNYFLCACKGKM